MFDSLAQMFDSCEPIKHLCEQIKHQCEPIKHLCELMFNQHGLNFNQLEQIKCSLAQMLDLFGQIIIMFARHWHLRERLPVSWGVRSIERASKLNFKQPIIREEKQMAKAKKSPGKNMTIAGQRLAGTKSIDKNLDLGGGLTNAAYEAKIQEQKTALDDYNESLSVSDQKLNVLNSLDKELGDWNERMLAGVGSRYGKDSDEYEMAGGVRKSERKKRATKSKDELKK